jgi:hypothetical protein
LGSFPPLVNEIINKCKYLKTHLEIDVFFIKIFSIYGAMSGGNFGLLGECYDPSFFFTGGLSSSDPDLTRRSKSYKLPIEFTIGSSYMTWHQVNVAFPEPLYQQFVRLVPAGQRTRFLTELAEAGLQRLKLQKALNETYGAWSHQPHPELKDGVDRYIRKQRRDRKTAR